MIDSRDDDVQISAKDFLNGFGEEIHRTLDLSTWHAGVDLGHESARFDREVRTAIERETVLEKRIREDFFPYLKSREGAPRNAGTHRADLDTIRRIHADVLFPGGMEACDGAIQVHDTIPLTIYQIGVSLVSYQGDQGTWCQRLYRRDLRQSCDDPIEEARAILERRAERGRRRDDLGKMAQKAILAYAERAILLRRSKSLWRLGHGNPVTYELLTGAGNLELMVASCNEMRELVEKHRKFAYVASAPKNRMLATVGQALRPMEFAIVRTLDEEVNQWFHQGRFAVDDSVRLTWDDEEIRSSEWLPRFIDQVCSQIVVGVYRASAMAPAQIFYAHVDYAEYAAHMILADSMLQEHHGRPLLTDMARHVCATVFGDSLDALADAAYAAAGVPWRYSNNGRARS